MKPHQHLLTPVKEDANLSEGHDNCTEISSETPYNLSTFISHKTAEITGTISGATTGVISYIQWENVIVTLATALVTGFLGACGAWLFTYLKGKFKKK